MSRGRRKKPSGAPAPSTIVPFTPGVADYESVVAVDDTIEYCTVREFIRKVPHRFTLWDLNAFGPMANKAADALCLAYVTRHVHGAGPARVFPKQLLFAVYRAMAVDRGWAPVEEAAAIDDARAKVALELKAMERTERQLAELSEKADNVEVLQSIQRLRDFLEVEQAALRATLATDGNSEAA